MRTTRTLVAAASLATGVLLAGCAPSEGGQSEQDAAPAEDSQNQNALAGFDPCKVFSQQQLNELGVEDPPEPHDQGVGESGCEYDADDSLITVLKGEQQDSQYWETRKGNFALYEPNQVGSHQGIKQVVKNASGGGVCDQAIRAGQGTVSVNITLVDGSDNAAACSKAMDIAKQVEPKLPA